MELTHLGQHSNVNIASRSHCRYTRINLKLTACNGENWLNLTGLKTWFCVTDIPAYLWNKAQYFYVERAKILEAVCLTCDVVIAGLETKSNCFGGIIGPTTQILELDRRR